MKKLEGTKTQANLMAAFAGESQAHTKYQYYASKAKKDGYNQIAAIFTETAMNEKEHAKIWFKLLHGGAIPGTAVNLQDAANGENYEWTDMYAAIVFSRDEDKIWKCSNCGHIVIGKAAPEVCPVCAHPQSYFEIKAENY